MKRLWKGTALATAGLVTLGGGFLAGRAFAGGIPSTGALTYSGTLEDATGAALTGSHNIQVNFWGAATGGTNVCPQTTSTSIALVAGRFTYPLPDTCTSAVKASPDVWAEVLVDGASLGRTKIGAVPYAVEAGHATNADNATNATNATNSTAASSATGSLATAIAALAAQSSVPIVVPGAPDIAPGPQPTAPYIFQAGSWSAATDANGIAAINFPQAFPHGVLNVIVSNGDACCNNTVPMAVKAGSLTGVQVQTGQANAGTRVSYLAIGW